jgi:hypothetical protein
VPNPRIDNGAQEIGDEVGEDDAEDHDDRDRFIQWQPWCASEKPPSPEFQGSPGLTAVHVARQGLTQACEVAH